MRWRSWLALLPVWLGGLSAALAAPLLVRAGTPEGLPGYEMDESGHLHIESTPKRRVFQCVEKTLNARFHWEALPTKRLLQRLSDGQLDIAFPMGFTPERAAKLLQSEPAWDNPDAWLSLRPIDPQDKSLRLAARLGSPQQVDHATEGYARVITSYTYEELARTLSLGMADAVVVPLSVYEEMRPLWPAGTRVTAGRARSSGFYLTQGDPKGLAAPLNEAIRRCRGAGK